MEWIPIVLGTFKAVVFGTGMFFAIKWHHDQAKKKEAEAKQRAEQAAGCGPGSVTNQAGGG